jgi:acetyl esterase
MIESSRPMQSRRKWLRRLALAIGGLLVIISAVFVLGAYAPSIPYVGVFGSVAVPLWPAWFIMFAAVGGALAWWGSHGTVRRVVVGLAMLAALGAIVITGRLTALAWANGVRLTIGHPFGWTGSLATVPADEVATYTHDLGEALNVRIYRPKGHAKSGSPILMYVHGGGWIGGSAAQRSADMRWFADQRWLVLSVDYSLSSTKRHLWNRVIDQIGCAMAWTAANAVSRGGDARRVAMIGDSAGGNLVLNAAYLANAGKLRSSCGGRIFPVNAVIALYPGVDLAAIYRNRYRPTGPQVNDMVSKYIGGSPEQYPERYAAVASATYIGPAAPPTLMFIGDHDHLVPPQSVWDFSEKARRGGVAMRTIGVPYADHVFDGTGIGNAIVRQLTLRFMTEQDVKSTGHAR